MNLRDPSTRSGPGPTDATLVAAARAGEGWAAAVLYRRHSDTVNGLVARLLGRDTDRDDIVQDSFSQALTSLHKLQDPQAFASWLCSIAVGTTHKLLRRRRLLERLGLRRTEPLDPDRLIESTAPPDVAAELRAIYRVIDALPVNVRTVFLLRRVEGLSLPEVGRMVGASLTTVKRRLAQAQEVIGNDNLEHST